MNNLYQNIQGQQFNPATISSIPYKPITFEKLSNVIGMTYNLSAIENMNTISLPRGGEQQIFFVKQVKKKKKDISQRKGNGIIFMTITWNKNAIQLIKSKILNE